jgi:uncharacterized protein YjbJ (UPF0337 family)
MTKSGRNLCAAPVFDWNAVLSTEDDMNWDQIEGNWKQMSGRVQKQWGKLTHDDLALVKGKQRELAGKIQERYGVTKEEAERQIKDWQSRL